MQSINRMRQKMREGHELPHTEMVESDTTVLDLPLTKKISGFFGQMIRYGNYFIKSVHTGCVLCIQCLCYFIEKG